MGWSSGSRLFEDVIDIMMRHIDDVKLRRSIYRDLIGAFEDADCDTLYECLNHDDSFDAAFEDIYPEHFEHLREED